MGRQKTVQKKLQPYEIGELDQYLFGQGTHYEIFRKMGAHKAVQKKQEGVYFAVWAPHAARVSVVGNLTHGILGRMRCIVRSRLGSTLVLCRERRKGICINSVSRHRQENGFLRRIRLQIMRSGVRVRLPE